MTLSLLGRCKRTRRFGTVISSSSVAVASRCAFAKGKVGAALSQNITDPRIGINFLDLLSDGKTAKESMKIVKSTFDNVEWRQLGLIDQHGHTAAYSGPQVLGVNNIVHGDNCLGLGNLLDNEQVPEAMVEAFIANEAKDLGERLMLALEAGLAAGGEAGPIHSAGLLMVGDYAFPEAELRIDWDPGDDTAIQKLRATWEEYAPRLKNYMQRVFDPEGSPSYGVPGDA